MKELRADIVLVVAHGTIGRVLHQQVQDNNEPIEVPISQEIPNAKIVQWL